jgi:DHA2 family multidrug resistance protein
MSDTTISLPRGSWRAINPWFVGAAVVIPSLMGAVGTTFVGVARPYIAGGLSAPAADDLWVMTSYLAANAFILPITGWLSAHFGRRNYFLWSIAIFTIASALCGMVTSLLQMILFRVIQGLGAGGLQPSSQAILLDSLPLEKQGAAQTMFSIAVLVGPIVGPILSGWIVVNYGWRWIFYINAPVGIVCFLVCYALLEDPEYLRHEWAELKKRPLNFDGIGLGLLALVIACWEVMLSKGQEWDWLGDPFWRVQTLLIVFVLSLAGLLCRELTFASPVVNFRVLGERNFAVSCGITFGALAVLYAASIALPLLLLTSFGYDAYAAGRVLWPAGVFSVLTLLVVARLLGWGIDARWLIASGLRAVNLIGSRSADRADLGRTEGAPPRGQRNITQAFRTRTGGLGLRLRRLQPCQQPVHWHNDDEVDHGRYDQEAEDVVQEVSPEDRPGADGREIGEAADQSNERGDEVLDDRVDDRSEGRSDHHRHRQIDHVSAQDEVPKPF